jgi:hypothetical protein
MKKLIAILLVSSLGFTGAAFAKPDDGKKKSKAAPQQHAPQQHVNVNAGPKNKMKVHQNTPNVNSANVNPAKIQKKEFHQQQKELRKTNVVQPNNVVTTNPSSLKKHQPNVQRNELPAVQNNRKTVINPQVNAATIQQNRAKYHNFKAQRSASIASAQFNQNYRIQNSQNWTGPQYRAFQEYRPQWHDRSWWRSSPFAANIVLIGGGYYYWNSGYWYPAWGYDNTYSYYPYDGPIYVGDNRVPFDRVLATVQATLQEQGYYRGEVDGLMGPLTRDALANYQRDHGLISTAALDQPTLASLGLG